MESFAPRYGDWMDPPPRSSSAPTAGPTSRARHGARELHTLRVRLAAKFLALSSAIARNHRLGRPPRNLTAYYA